MFFYQTAAVTAGNDQILYRYDSGNPHAGKWVICTGGPTPSGFDTYVGDIAFKLWGDTSAAFNQQWPRVRDDDYDANYWWSDSDFDWKTSSGLDLAGLMVGAGYQNNIVVVGADTSTGVPVIYFGSS